jgi:predicted O-methyltransferase YrrM
VRDNGNNGRLITTELSASKANRARQNIAEAGLSDIVEIRQGDAFETLRMERGETIDMLLLDGWKELYLPLLQLLESQLAPGALVIADDLNIAADALQSYVQYVRDPLRGYVSVEVPLDDGLEVSLRCKG